VLQQIQQNTVSVGATWPLFSFGQTTRQVGEQEKLAQAQEERRAGTRAEVATMWRKSRARLAALKDEAGAARQGVAGSRQLYRLVASSYHEGNARYLEVQSAQLRLLEAGVKLAQTEAQILIELAQLSSLTQ
jgi:outer membrane protein TolC